LFIHSTAIDACNSSNKASVKLKLGADVNRTVHKINKMRSMKLCNGVEMPIIGSKLAHTQWWFGITLPYFMIYTTKG